MGYVRTDGGEDIPSSDSIRKRFKFPKKSPEDCSGVHLTSVPRKIRSAFKKKSCGPTSPNLLACKKLKWQIDGVEFHRKNGLKKSGLIKSVLHKDKSVNSLPLSKDEEEVAHALFALASIIPNSEKACDYEVEGKQSGVKTTNYGSLIKEEVVRNVGVDPRAALENHDELIPPSVIKGPTSDDNFLESNKSWKRCLTHAYISHYVKDSINRVPLNCVDRGKWRKRLVGVGTSSNGSDSPNGKGGQKCYSFAQEAGSISTKAGDVVSTHIGLSPLSAPTAKEDTCTNAFIVAVESSVSII